MKYFMGFIGLLCIAGTGSAFEIEQSSAKTGTSGVTSFFKIGGDTFTVAAIPNVADLFETFDSIPAKYEKEMKDLVAGDEITPTETAQVIEEYYRANAFDFKSIKVRGIKLLGQKFVAWCSGFGLLYCRETQFRSGNWVEFEINGANQSGGMAGFQRQIFMIKKYPQTVPASVPPPIPSLFR